MDHDDMERDDPFDRMAASVIDGDDELAAELAERAIGEGIPPLRCLDRGYLLGVAEVSDAFGDGRAFLPELVMAGTAMKAALAVLEPAMTSDGAERQVLGTVVLATVQGDIHDIGKSLVGTLLTAQGFSVIDLGIDVSPAALLEAIDRTGPDIVGLSAMLTTTMTAQRAAIAAIEEAGVRADVRVLVGGAPVTAAWATEIRADGYGEDAPGAVAEARRLVDRPGTSSSATGFVARNSR